MKEEDIRRYLSIFIFIILIVHPNPIYAELKDRQTEYTLEDLYKIALERSEQIKISEEDFFIAEREKDKAISVLLPKLSAFGNYTQYSEDKFSSTPFGSFSIQPEWSASWGLRLDQTFSLSGRELTALKITDKGIKSNKYNLQAVREEYLLTVSKSYYDLLKADRAVEIAKANVERLKKHRDAAQMRLKVGDVTKTAVLRAEAELSGAQSELIKAENERSLARSILARVVGIKDDFKLKESIPKGLDTIDINLLKDKAISERAELKLSILQKEIAEDEVRYAKGSYWPTLSIEGVYEKRDEDPSMPFFLRETIYGALRINFPFFEGGLRRAEVREAEARKKQSELRYEDLKKTILIEVENAYLDLKTQKEILRSLQDQVTYAKDNFYTVSKQFEFGLVNSVDVMDANTLLVTAERQLSNAEYDYQLAIIRLKRATGTLLKDIVSNDY